MPLASYMFNGPLGLFCQNCHHKKKKAISIKHYWCPTSILSHVLKEEATDKKNRQLIQDFSLRWFKNTIIF